MYVTCFLRKARQWKKALQKHSHKPALKMVGQSQLRRRPIWTPRLKLPTWCWLRPVQTSQYLIRRNSARAQSYVTWRGPPMLNTRIFQTKACSCSMVALSNPHFP